MATERDILFRIDLKFGGGIGQELKRFKGNVGEVVDGVKNRLNRELDNTALKLKAVGRASSIATDKMKRGFSDDRKEINLLNSELTKTKQRLDDVAKSQRKISAGNSGGGILTGGGFLTSGRAGAAGAFFLSSGDALQNSGQDKAGAIGKAFGAVLIGGAAGAAAGGPIGAVAGAFAGLLTQTENLTATFGVSIDKINAQIGAKALTKINTITRGVTAKQQAGQITFENKVQGVLFDQALIRSRVGAGNEEIEKKFGSQLAKKSFEFKDKQLFNSSNALEVAIRGLRQVSKNEFIPQAQRDVAQSRIDQFKLQKKQVDHQGVLLRNANSISRFNNSGLEILQTKLQEDNRKKVQEKAEKQAKQKREADDRALDKQADQEIQRRRDPVGFRQDKRNKQLKEEIKQEIKAGNLQVNAVMNIDVNELSRQIKQSFEPDMRKLIARIDIDIDGIKRGLEISRIVSSTLDRII